MKKSKYEFVYYFFVVSLVVIAVVIGSFTDYILKNIPSRYSSLTIEEQDPVIILDAGHGGEDSGALGIDGTLEKDLNLKLCFEIRDVLSAFGYKSILTRTEDRMLYSPEQNVKGKRKQYDLKNRYLIASGYKNAFFVSIHMNKFPIEKYKGTQVYYSINNKTSKALAASVQSNVRALLQKDNNREIKASNNNIYLLDRLECPAVLIECGFMSNSEELFNLKDDEYRKKLALIIGYSIIENIC